jgi:ankyrin repeat protein
LSDTSIDPLGEAIAAGNIDEVKRLAALAKDIDDRNIYGMTPLANAVVSGDTELVQVILDAGANVHAKSKEPLALTDREYLPLALAARVGYIEVVEQLLDNMRCDETSSLDIEESLRKASYFKDKEIANKIAQAINSWREQCD